MLSHTKSPEPTVVGAGRAAGAGGKPRGVTPLCAVPVARPALLGFLRQL